MSLKKITSLTMLLSMFIMSYSGIILFIAPPGRIANWSNWQIVGLTKEQYANIHSSFMVLFIVATILHLFYNWKPITSYLKNKTRELIVLTSDMIVSIVIVLIFLMGTLFNIIPFSNFLQMGDSIKYSWEKEYGTAPYFHAELSSLEKFSKKMSYDLQKVQNILKEKGIRFKTTQSLLHIAKQNNISAQTIFNILKQNLKKTSGKSVPLTGLGRKSIDELAQTLGLPVDVFISKLNDIGIKNVDSKEKFKKVVEKYDLSPMDVLEKMQIKKK